MVGPPPPPAGFDWRRLPERGVGIVYMPGLAQFIAQASSVIDFIEVEPQQNWLQSTGQDRRCRLDDAAFAAIRGLGKPCVVHSVGCPIGGTEDLLDEQAEGLCASIQRLDAPWVSEHLSFNRFRLGGALHHANFLLPPLPCAASRDTAVAHLVRLRERVARPVAFENGVNYLRPQPGEWSDGRFVREIAERADCGILLDLHNAWTNARNGRQALDAFIDELPLERVVELHLAGGEWHEGYWLDAHSGLAQPELLALAADLVPRLPRLRAITFEVMDEALAAGRFDAAGLRGQLEILHRLWATRGTRVRRARRVHPRAVDDTLTIAPSDWESALGQLSIGLDAPAPSSTIEQLARQLAQDPGIRVLRTLVDASRAGMVVDTLRLSARLIALSRGRSTLVAALDGYWRQASPSAFPTQEAIGFGEYLLGQSLGIAGLDDLLRLEMAACRALADGEQVSVTLDDDPSAAIEALQQLRIPEPPRSPPRPVVLELVPDGVAA